MYIVMKIYRGFAISPWKRILPLATIELRTLNNRDDRNNHEQRLQRLLRSLILRDRLEAPWGIRVRLETPWDSRVRLETP